ncbi:MAG: type II secretion system protein GspG [Lentisphaerae bacterium]|nr:type II secretion system protein GspG [Lentisphaerota bacterium]
MNQTSDGWKRPLRYTIDTNGILSLSSFGRDGIPGGSGDNADMHKSYHAWKPDGTLWPTEETWLWDAEIR